MTQIPSFEEIRAAIPFGTGAGHQYRQRLWFFAAFSWLTPTGNGSAMKGWTAEIRVNGHADLTTKLPGILASK
jgi:hypothetical protein